MEELNIEKFSPKKAELIALSEKYESIEINGVADELGYLTVGEARKDLKGKRIEIQKTGKELRADALEFQRKVIFAEKELIEAIEPCERNLLAKQEKIDKEKIMIKKREAFPVRMKRLNDVIENLKLDKNESDYVLNLDDIPFESFLNEEKARLLKEREREIKEKEEKIKKEKEIIDAEKRARDQAQKEEKERIELEKARLEKERKDAEIKLKEQARQSELDKQQAIEKEIRKAKEEKERLMAEQEEKEQERIQAEKDAFLKKEQEKREMAEKEKSLLKEKRYKTFLKKHNYEKGDEFYIKTRFENNNKTVKILYKKIDSVEI